MKLNEEREAAGQAPAANPRNAAAGTIRTLEPNIVAQRRLDFYAYFSVAGGGVFSAAAVCDAWMLSSPLAFG